MSDRVESPSPDDDVSPASSRVDADAIGCAKCRWSLVGCAKCRVSAPSDRSRCPPLEERPGYARYAASRGLAMTTKPRGREGGARARKKSGGGEEESEASEDEAGGTEARRVKSARVSEAVAIEASMREKAAAVVVAAAAAERERERERAAAEREAVRADSQFKVDVDCGPFRSEVVGKNGDNLRILRFKAGAQIQAHATSETLVEVYGTREAIVKAKALIAEVMQKAEEKRKARASTPLQPRKPSLDVMSIVNDIKRPAMREQYEIMPGKLVLDAEEPEDTLSPEARAAVQMFVDKLPTLNKSRVTIAEFTNDALAISSYEGVPAFIVSTIRDRIASETSSATTRLTLLYLLDSIAQACRIESRGGSDATHAMYVRALRRNLSDIVKHMITIIKIDEATEMKDVEVPLDATVGEAHARYRRQAVQKILALWEKREVLAPSDIAIGKKAISKYRHEALKKQAREFDKRLQRQPEAKIKVQSDGLNANEFDDIAAMLGNQYGGIDANVLDLSALRSMKSQIAASTSPERAYSPSPMDCAAPMQPTAYRPSNSAGNSAHTDFRLESGELD